MSQKWNLQDIRPAKPRTPRNPIAEGGVTQIKPQIPIEKEEIPNILIEDGNKKNRKKLYIAIAVFVFVVGGGFIMSALMSGAELTVKPKHREPNVNAEFIAYTDKRPNELTYGILPLEASGERQVTATGEEQVEEQATGEIEIIKSTPGTERLIKNTRFKSENGLIFKIQESIVVPGSITDEDGNSVPGTTRAKVFAESPGEKYNLEPTRFTIPGFEEGGFTELFNAIYAENRTAFTGGFKGPKFMIDEDELNTAKQALQMELRDSLLSRVGSEKPAGSVVFDGAVSFTYTSLPAIEYGENLVTIKEQAMLQIPIFEEAEFAQYIAAATVPGYENNQVRIQDISALSFAYTSATTSSTNIANLPSLSFKLTGKPLLVWVYNEEELKADLVNAPKTSLTTVLGGYPSIESAVAVVRPFWKRTFPADSKDISIIEEIESE